MSPEKEQIIEPLSLRQVLLAPFRTLISGHIFVATYTAFVTGFLILFLFEFQHVTHELILASQVSQYFSSTAALETIITLLVWIALIPITIATIAMPIRAMWLNHKVAILDLMQWTLPALRKTTHALVVSTKALFVVIIPVIAMVVLHKVLRENNFLDEVEALYYPLGALVLALVLLRGIGVLFSVLIAVCTGVHPEVSLVISNEMIKTKIAHLGVILVISASVILLTHLGANQFDITAKRISIVEIYVLAFTLWYTLSSLCVLALETSEEYVRKHGRTFRPELMARVAEDVQPPYGS